MKKLLYWIDHYLEEAILVIFLILIACVMMLQIVVRYVFQSPLPWPEEFCRYCFVYSVMIATGYCIRNGSMLRVDVVINLFPRGIAFALDIFSKILATVFCFIMLKAAYNVMYTAYDIQQTSPANLDSVFFCASWLSARRCSWHSGNYSELYRIPKESAGSG